MAQATKAEQRGTDAGYKARKHATLKSRHARHAVKVSSCPLCNPGAKVAQQAEDTSEEQRSDA